MKRRSQLSCDETVRTRRRLTPFGALVAALLAGLPGGMPVPLAHASPPDACLEGYVWREAFPGDRVCVTPETRVQAAADNRRAAERRAPGGGAYGPDTCRPGFVWREARPDDRVCVTPEVRAQTARDNSLALARRAPPPATANGRPPRPPRADYPAAASALPRPAPAPAPTMSRPVIVPAPPPPAETTRAATFKLPTFPWPPPPFSTRMKLDRALLVAGQAAPTHGSVATHMEKALAANGYTQLSYYAVPDGFALVTQIERIDAQAASAAEQRWSTQIPAVSLIPFNLEAYLRALLGRNGDNFRVIVFTFTPTPFAAGGATVAPGEAMAWVEKGATALPAALAARPYGEDVVCTALIYEFTISSLGAAAKRPGDFDGERHLRAAGILPALERQR
jgi:hypothetical protein